MIKHASRRSTGVEKGKRPAGRQNCGAGAVLPVTFVDSSKRVITVSEYRDEDFLRLRRMYDSYSPKGKANGLPPVKKEVRDRWLSNAVENSTGFLACEGKRVVGHVILLPIPPGDRAEFGIFVHQDFQGSRIGTQLTRVIIAHAAEMEFKRLWLVVEPRNRRAIASTGAWVSASSAELTSKPI